LAIFELLCLLLSFLAKRGVREDIATFDARNIPKEIRESVEELLFKNKASFDPKVGSVVSYAFSLWGALSLPSICLDHLKS
jgi:hypothetical protein